MSLFFALAAMLSPAVADSVPATAPAPVETAQATATIAPLAKPVAAKPKLLCREVATTGSNLALKRTCATAAQWRAAGP